MARPLFIYVSAKADERAEVKEFVEYYLNNGMQILKDVNYIPLTFKDYKHALVNYKTKKTGTAFGGVAEVGVTVAELLRRNPSE